MLTSFYEQTYGFAEPSKLFTFDYFWECGLNSSKQEVGSLIVY